MRLITDPAELQSSERPILLALRALKLGDLLVAVPAIKGLRRAFPEHELVLAVPGWLQPIAELVPGVDALLPTPGLDELLPIAPGVVDVAANLHGNGLESRRVIDALEARVAIVHAVSDVHEGLPWRDGILERDRWARLVNAHGADADPNEVAINVPLVSPPAAQAIVVHVGAFYGSRAWPVERFAAVARTLADTGKPVVLTGSAADHDRAAAVSELAGEGVARNLAGEIDLTEFAALVSDAALVVTVDTGAAHLASAYRRPSVVIFGPAPPEEWGPPPGPHRVLTDASLRVGDTFGSEPDPALLAVTTEDVLAAARAVLEPSAAPSR